MKILQNDPIFKPCPVYIFSLIVYWFLCIFYKPLYHYFYKKAYYHTIKVLNLILIFFSSLKISMTKGIVQIVLSIFSLIIVVISMFYFGYEEVYSQENLKRCFPVFESSSVPKFNKSWESVIKEETNIAFKTEECKTDQKINLGSKTNIYLKPELIYRKNKQICDILKNKLITNYEYLSKHNCKNASIMNETNIIVKMAFHMMLNCHFDEKANNDCMKIYLLMNKLHQGKSCEYHCITDGVFRDTNKVVDCCLKKYNEQFYKDLEIFKFDLFVPTNFYEECKNEVNKGKNPLFKSERIDKIKNDTVAKRVKRSANNILIKDDIDLKYENGNFILFENPKSSFSVLSLQDNSAEQTLDGLH